MIYQMIGAALIANGITIIILAIATLIWKKFNKSDRRRDVLEVGQK